MGRLLDASIACLGPNSVDEGMLAHADIKWRTAILVRGAFCRGAWVSS